jgi:hypothetical protein
MNEVERIKQDINELITVNTEKGIYYAPYCVCEKYAETIKNWLTDQWYELNELPDGVGNTNIHFDIIWGQAVSKANYLKAYNKFKESDENKFSLTIYHKHVSDITRYARINHNLVAVESEVLSVQIPVTFKKIISNPTTHNQPPPLVH